MVTAVVALATCGRKAGAAGGAAGLEVLLLLQRAGKWAEQVVPAGQAEQPRPARYISPRMKLPLGP